MSQELERDNLYNASHHLLLCVIRLPPHSESRILHLCSRSSDEDSEEDDEAEEDEYDEDNERLENEGGHSGRNAQPPGTSVSGVNGSSPRGHSGVSSVRVDQTGEEVPGPLPPDQQHSLEEALLKQMEMQKKLHEQLEVGFTSTCEEIVPWSSIGG